MLSLSRKILMSEHMSVLEDTGPYCNGRYFVENYSHEMQHWRIVPRAMKFELGDSAF